jgi:hypothetical protein
VNFWPWLKLKAGQSQAISPPINPLTSSGFQVAGMETLSQPDRIFHQGHSVPESTPKEIPTSNSLWILADTDPVLLFKVWIVRFAASAWRFCLGIFSSCNP